MPGRSTTTPQPQPGQIVPPDRPASPAESNGTVVSRTSSASKVASNPNRFRRWAKGVKLDSFIKTDIPQGELFDTIRRLQQAATILPEWLKHKDSPQFTYIAQGYEPAKNILCGQVVLDCELEQTILTQIEDRPLSAAIPIILQTYHHHLWATKFRDPPTEMDMRIGIDNMMAHIHDVHLKETEFLKYWTERDLKLPAGNSNIQIATTTTDGFSFFLLPEFEAYNLPGIVRSTFEAYNPTERMDVVVVHSVLEYKRKLSGKNQVIMGVVSGLYQRRALNMRDHFVFGVFQEDTYDINVVAGIWRTDDSPIEIYQVAVFSLKTPIDTVRLYLVLRAIRQLAVQYREELKDHTGSLPFYVAVSKKAPDNVWARNSHDSNSSDASDDSIESDDFTDSDELTNVNDFTITGLTNPADLHNPGDAIAGENLATIEQVDKYEMTCAFVQRLRSDPPGVGSSMNDATLAKAPEDP